MQIDNSPVYRPQEFQTRFLYPFMFQRGEVPAATNAFLSAQSTRFEGGQGLHLWEKIEPIEFYREELFDYSLDYLFSHRLDSGCTYLRFNPALANQWFQGVHVTLPRLGKLPEQCIKLKEPAFIELFLSNHGVGVLSVLLQPLLSEKESPKEVIVAFNYLLTHSHRYPPVEFHCPHLQEDEEKWSQLSQEDRDRIPPPPDATLPILQRIGRKGCSFALGELIEGDCLLRPCDIANLPRLLQQLNDKNNPVSRFLGENAHLQKCLEGVSPNSVISSREAKQFIDALNRVLRDRPPFYEPSRFAKVSISPDLKGIIEQRHRGEARLRIHRALFEAAFPDTCTGYKSDNLMTPLETHGLLRAQDRLAVYTTVRFDETVDLKDTRVREDVFPFLSTLAQIEEPGHAGAVSDLPCVTHAVQNRRHWASVSLLGAAHLCADQPDNHSFNSDRLPHLTQKYFIPFLLATLQRLTLQKLIDDANEVVRDPNQNTPEGIAKLREHFLNFSVDGFFTQISSRAAVHRYYQLCQEGLGVFQALEALQRAFGEIESRQTDARQIKIAEDLHRNALATQATQHSINEQLITVARVQVKLEVLEVLIFAIYGGELGHLLLPEHHSELKQYLFVLGGTLIGILLGLFILRPSWRHFLDHWGASPRREDSIKK